MRSRISEHGLSCSPNERRVSCTEFSHISLIGAKQTLVNAERYITPELKEYEEKILGAQEKITVIETRLFNELVGQLAEYIQLRYGPNRRLRNILSAP